MALPVVIPNCAFCTLYFSLNGEIGVNVYATRILSGTIDQIKADSVGAAIKAAFTAQAATFASTTRLEKVGLRDMRASAYPEYLDGNAGVPGTGTGDPLPRQIAAVVTLRTALAGARYRGRSYIGGFSETENSTTGSISAALQASVVSWVQGVDGAMQANGLKMAVASRPAERKTVVETTFHADGTSTQRTLSNQPARAASLADVTSYESRNTTWETQRRRNNGRGSELGQTLAQRVAKRATLPA